MGGGWHECTLDSPLCRPEGAFFATEGPAFRRMKFLPTVCFAIVASLKRASFVASLLRMTQGCRPAG